MNSQPSISRITVLEVTDQSSYGLELILDNPTDENIWLEQVHLHGFFAVLVDISPLQRPYGSIKYKIQMNYDITSETPKKSLFHIHGEASEDSDWSYPVSGELSYGYLDSQDEEHSKLWEIPKEYNRSSFLQTEYWRYQIRFPVIFRIEPRDRFVARLLFGAPNKLVFKKSFREGTYLKMSLNAKSSFSVSATAADGFVIQREMDASFLEFIANRGKQVEQFEDISATTSSNTSMLLYQLDTRLGDIQQTLETQFNEIKYGQAFYYYHLSKAHRKSVEQILDFVSQNSIEQNEIQETIDTIRRVLHNIQTSFKSLDLEIQELISATEKIVESKVGLRQKLELTLPIIPLLLDYKAEFETGGDADTKGLLDELKERWSSLKRQVRP